MRKFYRASIDGVGLDYTKASTPSGSWRLLEKNLNQTRDNLRASGFRVNLVIDLEESDALVVADVVEAVAPKPVGRIIGFLKGLLK